MSYSYSKDSMDEYEYEGDGHPEFIIGKRES